MKDKKIRTGKEKKKYSLSPHERDQLRLWIKATPSQRLSWLEDAIRLAAKAKVIK